MTKTQILKNIKKMSGIRVFETKTAWYYFKVQDGNIYDGMIEYKKSRRTRSIKYKDAVKFITKSRLFTEIKF